MFKMAVYEDHRIKILGDLSYVKFFKRCTVKLSKRACRIQCKSYFLQKIKNMFTSNTPTEYFNSMV